MSRVLMEASEHETATIAVVEALAAARNVDATDLDLCLYDYLDPDALNRLYDHADADGAAWRLKLEAERFDVTVRSDGLVTVE